MLIPMLLVAAYQWNDFENTGGQIEQLKVTWYGYLFHQCHMLSQQIIIHIIHRLSSNEVT